MDRILPQDSRYGQWPWVLLALLLLVPVVAWIATVQPSPPRIAEVVGPLLSGIGGIGTLVLAYLYTQQHQELRTQTELQEIEHEPSIQSDRIRGHFIEKFGSSWFRIELSNTGKGVARDLKLRIEPSVDCEEFYPETTTHEMSRVRESGEDTPWVNTRSAYLNPGENAVEFQANAAMHMSDTADSNEGVFGHVSNQLHHHGVEKMRMKLFVEYTGPGGEASESQIFDFLLPIKGRASLQNTLSNSLPSDAPNADDRVGTNRADMELHSHENA